MYAPTPADFDALVALARARGTDPTGVALTLYIESAGFNPASAGPNGDGAVSGLNQMSIANLAALKPPLTPAQWMAMTVAQQLAVIFPWWDGLAKAFNGGRFPPDGSNLLALNFLPKYYQSSGAALNPNAPIVSSPDPYYARNTFYDPDKTGSITVNTIAKRQAQQAAAGGARWQLLANGVASAIARAGGGGGSSSPVVPPAASVSGSSSTNADGVLALLAIFAAVLYLRKR